MSLRVADPATLSALLGDPVSLTAAASAAAGRPGVSVASVVGDTDAIERLLAAVATPWDG